LSKQINGPGKSITFNVMGFAHPISGTDASDKILANNRALAVAKILKSLGVNTKVEYMGMGRATVNNPSSRYVSIEVGNSLSKVKELTLLGKYY
jgi:hypothetical protein